MTPPKFDLALAELWVRLAQLLPELQPLEKQALKL